MDTLPSELCQEIFSRLAGFNQRFDFVRPNLPEFGDAIRAPLRIAATCRHWRTLVLNYPELWAFVHARDDRPEDDTHLRMCIERSGQHPLDVWILSDAESSSDAATDGEGELEGDSESESEGKDTRGYSNSPAMFYKWLDLLQSNAHRWRRVRFDFPRPTPIDKFDTFTKPMPLLEHLVMSASRVRGSAGYMVNRSWESNPERLYFQGCPNLRTLASHSTLMVPATTLSRLKCLHFGVRGMERDGPLWAALARTPALEELSVSRLIAEPPSSPVHLPALRRLGLLGYYDFDNKRWDKYLNVPNVDTLIISVEPCDNLRNTFASFSSTVRHLVITTIEPQGDGGGYLYSGDAKALDSLQNVETLELRDIPHSMFEDNPDEFFGSLAGIGDTPIPRWGPTLRKIILRDCDIEVRHCGSLATLVNMRETAARDSAVDAFELQLINTRLLKGWREKVPESMNSVKHLFGSSIVELFDASSDDPSENEDERDDEPDGAIVDDDPRQNDCVLETSNEPARVGRHE
ncbi:hypothetical protein BKA62DRAFT_709190 [Auriculariales sp. MPI-PUGE-AT-0066]|nr:hypothetical protein BKA62DRAFT_709190 [Auriculariales sp. MPI-PUGE-AT-0066]